MILVLQHEIGHGVNNMAAQVSNQFTGRSGTNWHEIQWILYHTVGQTLPDVPKVMIHNTNDIRVKQYKGRAQCDAVLGIIAIMFIYWFHFYTI